jgi:hypothetical protein
MRRIRTFSIWIAGEVLGYNQPDSGGQRARDRLQLKELDEQSNRDD